MGTLNRTTANLNNHTRTALYLSAPEALVGDGTYKSPGTNVTELNAVFTENINYTGGSAVYTGNETIQIKIESTISISSASAGTTVFITSGINGTPSTTQEVTSVLTNANDIKELTHHGIFVLEPGDTMDFFVKASANVTLEKAIWNISRFD